jgi:squalene-associated FAD-dependent desaturase
MKRAVVLGGGFAGLAAGVALAGRGVAVTVCEARQRLGGRAHSFRDAATGAVVDNGQHAMMGCYADTIEFLRRIGAAGKLVRQRSMRVDFAHPALGRGAIACPGWPSPLHVLAGLLGYRLLSRRERLRAVLGGARLVAMRRGRDPRLTAETVEQVLVSLGQSAHARRCFWDPIVLATLNELPARAAAAPLACVLARAFFGARDDSQFVLPRVGLSELYTDDARRFIEARGGHVATGVPAAALAVRDDRCVGVTLRDGRRLDADGCISTLPPRALGGLIPAALCPRGLERLESSPIVSTHLWLDRPVLPADFVGLLGTTTQWAFSRTRLAGEGAGEGEMVSAVISAGREVVGWDGDAVAERVVADLRAALPAARAATVRRTVVVKEKHATTAPTPEAERLRPAAETRLAGFWLAGDWTATGLPPTIESAVVSGHRAADLLAAQLAV